MLYVILSGRLGCSKSRKKSFKERKMMRKLMIVLLALGFVSTAALAEGKKRNKRVKKELTAEEKAKKEARLKKLVEQLKKEYPEDIANYEKLLADGKEKEAKTALHEILKKRELARLDKLAEKYPDQVANIKKLMEDKSKAGRKALNEAKKELWKQIKEDNKKAKKPKKAKKAKKAETTEDDA